MSRRRRVRPSGAAPSVACSSTGSLALAATTIALGSLLLFVAQPMISKRLLPILGGGSFVWLGAMVVFQALLLLGYAGTHVLLRRLGTVRHRSFHLALALGALGFFLWDPAPEALGGAPAPLRVALAILGSIGPPFVVLSAGSPLLQHWRAGDAAAAHQSPYVLYAASNAGSLVGLALYPLLLEPHLGLAAQRSLWTGAYAVYVLLLWRTGRRAAPPVASPAAGTPPGPHTRAGWRLRAGLGSAALVVVTELITEDVGGSPLLWTLPLGAYLLSFVVVFLSSQISRPRAWRPIALLAATAALLLLHTRTLALGLWPATGLAVVALFVACVHLHGDLERAKPAPRWLTAYYVDLSLGGCLGGALIALGAPILLRSPFEPWPVLLSVLAVGLWESAHSARARIVLVATLAAASLGAYLIEETTLALPIASWRNPSVTLRARSYYGSYTIEEEPEQSDGEDTWMPARLLRNGSTLHGGQARDAAGRLLPIAYYHPATLVGQAMLRLHPRHVAVVGLGTGALAAYGSAEQSFVFFEIDPLDVVLATQRFDLLRETPAQVRHVLGDARVTLRKEAAQSFDLVVLDAFSGDAVPLHLLTLEAVREYLRVLAPGGALLFHISSRHVDLSPVLLGLARRLDLAAAFDVSTERLPHWQFEGYWVALCPDAAVLPRLLGGKLPNRPASDREVLWTDDRNSLFDVLF